MLDKNPKLAELLNTLSAKLDDATMAKLNATVDVDKKTVEEVVGGFLKPQRTREPRSGRQLHGSGARGSRPPSS